MAVYGSKTRSQILVSMLNALEANAGVTAIYPGSVARAFAEAVSSEISDLYEAFRYSCEQGDLLTASGRSLDLIGDLYGIQRKSVSSYVAEERASNNIQFTLDKAYSADIVIPQGTLVYNDVSNFVTKQYSFTLVNSVTIPAGVKMAYGRIEPSFNDNTYVAPRNSLVRHNFVAPATVIVYCTNPKEVQSVLNSESDSSYRRRIISSMKSKVSGTAESVRFSALSVKGVRDVRIREASYGIGSCDVIVVPESASLLAKLGEDVLSAIAAVKPVGIKFNVRIAEKVSISVSANITVSPGNSSQVLNSVNRQAELFMTRYLNSLTIGDTLSISKIEQNIMSSSDIIRGVNITSISANGRQMPLRDYTPTSVREYIGAGNISVNSVIIGASSY
jgi:uncharacterized phage protein gp47/JayE